MHLTWLSTSATSPTIHGDNRIDSGRRTHRPSPAVGPLPPTPQATRAQFRKRAPVNTASRAPERRRTTATRMRRPPRTGRLRQRRVVRDGDRRIANHRPNERTERRSTGAVGGAHDLRPWVPPAHPDRDGSTVWRARPPRPNTP